jgi:hypothetical protein
MHKSLVSLAAAINREHKACQAAAEFALKSAFEVGRLLTEAKGRVEHGEWLPWVGRHCKFGIRQAQGYMRLFAHREHVESKMRSSDSHLEGLHGALDLIRQPSPNTTIVVAKPERTFYPPANVKITQEFKTYAAPTVKIADMWSNLPTQNEPMEADDRPGLKTLTINVRDPAQAARCIFAEMTQLEWDIFRMEVEKIDSE